MRKLGSVAYFVINIEILIKRITSGRLGLIKRNVDSIIKIVEVGRRHRDGRVNSNAEISVECLVE